MHEDHLYGRRSRFHATRLCHTRPIQSRARIYVHTYVHTHTHARSSHVERCSLSLRPPIPPYCLSFMGTLLTFYRRAVARISTVFFSSFLFRSLCLSFSVHRFIHPFHHSPVKHPPVSPVPKSCMKMIFFFPLPSYV